MLIYKVRDGFGGNAGNRTGGMPDMAFRVAIGFDSVMDLVGTLGIEPRTITLKGCCSTD